MLNNLQINAIQSGIESDFICCITGSAGTGKTTIIKEIVRYFIDNSELKTAVLAPTGRASRILKSKIPDLTQVNTIHKHLEFKSFDRGETFRPTRNESNLLDSDVVVIDEASMVTHELFGQLLKACKPNVKIVLVGDSNQLPPIEDNVKTSLFKQCIDKFGSTELKIEYRFGSQANISALAKNVLKGRFNEVMKSDLAYRLDRGLEQIVLTKMCSNPKYWGFDSQIISPTYKGICGCDYINKMCQAFTADKFKSYRINDKFYLNDKVICTKNTDYYSNGDVFILKDIDENHINLLDEKYNLLSTPRFIPNPYNSRVNIDLAEQLSLAYSITTHKSQGGEYENVVYILGSSSYFMSSKENIYTGLTRSSDKLVFLYDYNTLKKGLCNENSV